MNRQHENKLRMLHGVLYFFKEEAATFDPIPHFTAPIAELNSLSEKIIKEEVTISSNSTGATEHKNDLRHKLEEVCNKIGSAVLVYGANNGQPDILDMADYLSGNLIRVSESELYVLAIQLYRTADPVKGFLAPYGSGTTDVALLNTQSSAFVDQIHVPRNFRKTRSQAVQQQTALFKQADEVLQKLDTYMAVFQFNQHSLFALYKLTRAITNRPSGHTVHTKRGRVLPAFVAHAAFKPELLKPTSKITLYNLGKTGNILFYFSTRANEHLNPNTKLTTVSPGTPVTITASEAGYTLHQTQLNIYNPNVLHGRWKAVVERA